MLFVGGLIFWGLAGFFVGVFGIDAGLWWVSVLANLIFFVPIVFFGWEQLRWRLIWGLLGVAVWAYLIEYVGLVSGFPYGSFEYGEAIGPKVFGILPLVLPLAYLPLVVAAKVWGKKMVLSLLILIGLDLVVDPAAVKFGLWSYEAGGWFFGVPWTNYAGWVFSGAVSLWLLNWFWKDEGDKRMGFGAAWMLMFWIVAVLTNVMNSYIL